jgi:hypothetical protein
VIASVPVLAIARSSWRTDVPTSLTVFLCVTIASSQVQFDYMDTEGLAARSAVVRDNIVTDVAQLATHSKGPMFAPRGAFWTDGAYGLQRGGAPAPTVVGGLPLHRDLLYRNNTISSGAWRSYLFGAVIVRTWVYDVEL